MTAALGYGRGRWLCRRGGKAACASAGELARRAPEKFLEGGDVEITAAFPAGVIAGSEANLIAAASGENHEHTVMYPEFAATADKEGYAEVAAVMRNIAIAEAYHEKRFLALAKDIKEGRMFVRTKPTVWRCLNCGCLAEGDHAPEMCPACAHPKAYFAELNYSF